MLNNIQNISKIIYFPEKHIIELLMKNEVDDRKLSVLTEIRISFIEELNSLIKSHNTSDIFDKKYFKSYRKSNH